MMTKTIQAPWVNLVTVTMISTLRVMMAPTRLVARLRHTVPRSAQPSLSIRNQWRTMPVCPRVNETNTPMM